MIFRKAAAYLQGLADRFKTVTVIGPRQSGKTTLVKHCFPDRDYVNLENPQVREFAQQDPAGFIKQYSQGAIIDEIQRVPQLISYIQVVVDERDGRGLFILTGSHQFQLLEQVSQSLAGRTFLFRLLPLSLGELQASDLLPEDLNQILTHGLYPGIYAPKVIPSEVQQAYFDTYIQKDVRQITNVKDLSTFQRFMALCAGRIGQLLNKESLSADLGINVKTVEDWLSVLEASFVLMRLPPFWTNTRKRLIKSPKLYFLDTGIASWLLNIQNPHEMAYHPLRGNLFENLIIIEALKSRYHAGQASNLFFYRDARKREIDLILDYGEKCFPIEIKSAATYLADFAKNLDQIDENRQLGRAVIYGGDETQERSTVKVVPWREAPNLFANIAKN